MNSLQAHDKDVSFFDLVYQIVRLIPAGRVTSYGAIARYLGTGRSARMVGWAMNNAHTVLPEIPAHRVVNRNGLLSGRAHFKPPESMEQKLVEEGVFIKDNQVQFFNDVFWDPATELKIN
ncbi:MAG: cysteine methyltransferase [Bacteroidetes bacterium]|nr:cysteine methyltransferase [Bacteroidota bacterium]